MLVIGISAFYHDSAAAIVRDGEIIAAAQQERFSRKKNDCAFPADAVAYCLDAAGATLADVDYVAFYDKPLLTFGRLLETYIAFAPSGFRSFVKSIPTWVKEKVLQRKLILDGVNALGRGTLDDDKILFGFHHHSHAASAFYPSPFEKAAILTLDGVGEWATMSFGVGNGDKVDLLREIRFPHSIGLLYSAFTYYLGFAINDGEYKVMGLAPYGEPRFENTIRENLIDIKDDGSFRLNMDYFNYCTDLTMTNDRFHQLFGRKPRHPQEPISQFDMDLARSVQVVTEDVVLRLCRQLHKETGEENLCLAGGVALNCVANGRIQRESPFRNIWIQPAAGDAGASLGVALAVDHAFSPRNKPRKANEGDGMKGAYLGPAYAMDEITAVLDGAGAKYQVMDEAGLLDAAAETLAGEGVVGWFQGRMEFGPRALGNRSILGDARSSRMQRMLNLKIKYRESFRPFAPAVLAEDAKEFFDLYVPSPYMMLVAPVTEKRRITSKDASNAEGLDKLHQIRSDIPAVTHVDYSARVQTIDEATNPRFYRLLSTFKQRTGYGVLVNTSFNVRDEPIVCSPEDGYHCFMATEMDMLVIGDAVLRKVDQ